MSTLQDTMTTVPGSGDRHSGAVAKWRGRAIGALSDMAATATDTTAASADTAVPASGETAGATTEAASATSETESADASTSGRTMSAVAGISGATLLDSPGGSELASVEVGARLTVNGQSEDGNWLLASDGSTSGWVQQSDVIGFNMASLPVLSIQETAAAVNTGDGQVTTDATSQVSTTGATESAVVAASTGTDAAATETAPTAQTELVTVIATVSLDDGRLNIRSGPGTDYDVLGKATSGDQYYALGRDSSRDWVMVLVNGDEVGWVAARYVVLSESAAETPDATDGSLLTSLPITEAGASVETSAQTSLLSQLPALSDTYASASQASTNGDTVLVSATSLGSDAALASDASSP